MFKLCRTFVLALALSFISCVPLQSIEPQPVPVTIATLYDTVIFDIAVIGSGVPSQQALTFLKSKIKQYRISRNVVIRQRQDIQPLLPIWSLSQVTEFETRHRQLQDEDPNDRILVVFISYLPGIYINGNVTGIAGIQYGKTSFAIFRSVTDDSWEGVVLLHELSHMLNIARKGNRTVAPINPDRPNHCNDTNCVMFWRAGVKRTQYCTVCIAELGQLIRGEPLKTVKLY